MSEQQESSTRQQRLNEIIAEYFAVAEAGDSPDREQFIERHAPFATELREFFNDGQIFERMAQTLSLAPGVAAASSLAAGERVKYFGDYELADELARGGMGIVYKARQISLNRFVALKMILSGQFASTAEVIRFHTEAESAAALDHPNIVPIYEVGEHHGQHYFTMKLIDGTSIEQWAKSTQPAQRQIAALLATVARAVYFGHQRGILHRDLKPGNVLVDSAGVPYVVDFGIAKRAEADHGLTLTTDVLGSPAYMSPEQAAGRAREISVATDVYGLGAILYCLLTGRPPFVADSAAQTLRMVLEAEPQRPRAVQAGTDRDLQTICLKCLEKNPGKRYASAQAVAEDLERWLAGKPILARPVSRAERIAKWSRRRPSLAALIAVSLVLLAVLAWVLPVSYVRVRLALTRETAARARESAAMQESRDRLVQTSVTRGLEAMDADDPGAALVWWANALRDETDPQRQRVLRTRITLGLGQMPRMRQLLKGVTPLCFADDGKSLVGFEGDALGTECRAYRDFQGSVLIRRDLTRPRKLSTAPVPSTSSGVMGSIQGVLSRLGSRNSVASSTAGTPEITANVGKSVVFTDVTTPVTRLAQTNSVTGGITLTFWDVKQLKPLGTTSVLPNPPRYIGYSADGSRAAALIETPALGGDIRGTIQSFDVNFGAEVGPAISLTGVRWLQMNATGDRIATVSKNEDAERKPGVRLSAAVWDVTRGKPLFEAPFGPKNDDPNSMYEGQAIFSADASRLLTLWGTGATAAMRTWDLRAGKPLSDEQFLASLDIGAGPSFIAPAGGFQGNESVWVNQGKTVGFRNTQGGDSFSLRSELNPVGNALETEQIVYSPDGRVFASAARLKDGFAVSLWSADDHHLLATQITPGSRLSRVLFTPDSRRVAINAGNFPDVTQVLDVTPPVEQSSHPRLFTGPNGAGIVLAMSRDGRRSLSQTWSQTKKGTMLLEIVDLQTGGSVQVSSPFGNVVHASFSPDSSRFVIAGQSGPGPVSLAVMRSEDGAMVINPFQPSPAEPTSGCYSVAFTPDGQWFVADFGKREGDWQQFPRQAWNAATGAKLDFPGAGNPNPSVVVFSDDSRSVLLADHPHSNFYDHAGVRVWDMTTRQAVSPVLPQGVQCARFSPDGRSVLVYGRNNSGNMPLTLYQIATGGKTWSVTTDLDVCQNLTFSRDGSKIAVSGDKATEIRSALDGKIASHPINRGLGYNYLDPLGTVQFNDDGLLLIIGTTGDSGGVQIFDIRTAELIATFPMQWAFQSMAVPAFPGNGRMLLVRDFKPVEINFAPDERDAGTLESVIHLLSGRKLDSTGGLVPLPVDEMAQSWDALIAAGAPEVGEPHLTH